MSNAQECRRLAAVLLSPAIQKRCDDAGDLRFRPLEVDGFVNALSAAADAQEQLQAECAAMIPLIEELRDSSDPAICDGWHGQHNPCGCCEQIRKDCDAAIAGGAGSHFLAERREMLALLQDLTHLPCEVNVGISDICGVTATCYNCQLVKHAQALLRKRA